MSRGDYSRTSKFWFPAIASASLLIMIGSAFAQGSLSPEDRGSIWNHQVEGQDATYAQLTLQRDTSTELEPALLPLPVPVLAACGGLLIIMAVRQRIHRTY